MKEHLQFLFSLRELYKLPKGRAGSYRPPAERPRPQAGRWVMVTLLTLAGCVTSLKGEVRSVAERFASVVFDDGISAQEAQIIAQRQLTKSNLVRLYDLSDPQVVKDVADLPRHEEFWFVSFKERRSSSIEFVYMVLVHKKTGYVQFADDYAQSKRWVLEAALLSFENP